jgi:hypothetical protein
MAVLGTRTTGSVSAQFLSDGRSGQQDNNLVVSSGNRAPENGHAYSMGIRAGSESATTCSTRLVTYDVSTGGHDITDAIIVGMTDLIPITSDWDSNKPLYEEELQASFLVQNGNYLYIGFHETNGLLEVGKTGTSGEAGHPTGTSSSDSPIEPFPFEGYWFLNGRMYVWLNYEPNVAPDVPSDFSPTDGASVTDTTPTYAADFTDANQSLPGGVTSLEKLLNYQIQVRSVTAENATSGTVVWDSGTVAASGTEQTNSRFSKDHGGSALSLGTRYQWRARVQDIFGTWSSWSHADAAAWSDFNVASGGIVTLDGTPTGKITDTTPDFQARYHHVSGTAADRAQIRLYTGSNLLSTSPSLTDPQGFAKAVASSALPGTLFTITAAESGFGTLASGVNYGYSVRARTAAGAWSDWSAIRTFNTNARPTTPTNLLAGNKPSGGVVSSLPLITLQTTDADGDALTVSLRIKNSGGTVLFTRTMTYDATLYSGAGGYKYQTTGTDFATFATYKYDASATDGDLTSAQSSESTVVYAQGPAVTVTSPTEAEVITTDTPTFTWTTTDQQKKRIYVYQADDDTLIHDSTELTNVTSSYTMPADILVNNTDYYVVVQVTNSAPLTGTSAARNFTLTYVSPDTVVGFFATADYADFDQQPSVIRLTWDPVTTDASAFEGYVLYRRNAGQAFADAIVINTFSNREQSTWTDTTPQSGIEQVYSIVQKVRESSIDVLTSEPAESPATVNLLGSVVSDVRDGLQLRAVFDSVQERTETVVREYTELPTWEGGAPWLFEGPSYYRPIEMEALLYDTGPATPDDVLVALRGEPYEPFPLTAPYGGLSGVRADGSLVLACYRDERGLKIFGRVRDAEISYTRLLRAYASFTFQPVNYSEAVTE